jgi:LemA protein
MQVKWWHGCLAMGGLMVFLAVCMGGCVVSKIPQLKQENIAVDRAWAEVEGALQRRADLIPNLVNVVKGSANFEHDTLTDVIKARQNVTNIVVKPDDPESMKKFGDAHQRLSVATGNLMNFVRERYPKLATTAAFVGLMAQLEGTENRLRVERQNYNTAVETLNNDLVSISGSIANTWAGVKPREFFKADEGAKTVPKVDFEKKG